MAPPDSRSASPAAPTATEIVTRPDPGLARGTWEAPAWIFWVILAFVLLGSAAWVLRRRRVATQAAPPSATSRRP